MSNWNKTIFQTYECDFSQLHNVYQKNCEMWKSVYPNWTHYYVNAEQRREEVKSILNLSNDAINIYDKYSGPLQSDFWRYTITGKYGGMYSDLDSIPMSNAEIFIFGLNKNIQLITLPNTKNPRQHWIGPNNSNYIIKMNSSIGNQMILEINEFLEQSAIYHKNGMKPPSLFSIKYFANLINKNINFVSQGYTEEYVSHSLDYKPDRNYRNLIEKKEEIGFFDSATSDIKFFEIHKD